MGASMSPSAAARSMGRRLADGAGCRGRVPPPHGSAPTRKPLGEVEKRGFGRAHRLVTKVRIGLVKFLEHRIADERILRLAKKWLAAGVLEGSLDKLVFQRGDSDRASLPIGFRDVNASRRLGPVRSSVQTVVQVREARLEFLPVRLPRDAVDARCGTARQRAVRSPKSIERHVMEERSELRLPVLSCCLTYTVERIGRDDPALSPGRVLLVRVPLGRTPSLHHLRRRSRAFVRWLRRYYRPV